MHWILLVGAIIFEVFGTTSMKLSDGFTKLVPSIVMGVCYIVSLSLLTLALRKLDVSIAYALWSGLGTLLISLIGIVWFKEPATAIKLASIALIILGVVGLNLGGGTH